MNKPYAIIAVILVIFICALVFWSIIQKIDTVTLPPNAAQPEEGGVTPLPENAIPTIRNIEERIDLNREVQKAVEKAAQMPSRVKVEGGEEARIESPTPKETSNNTADGIPPKQEFRFPTHEEREASESQTGILAY